MVKYVAGIQYVGTAYSGWQKQKHSRSVQQVVEHAFSQIADQPITLYCSGRTDTGVHAKEQVVHFETDVKRSDYAWRMGSNSTLPDDVRVLWCHKAEDDFHARFSATSRQYRYIIFNAQAESALLKNRVLWIPYSINDVDMNLAAQALSGEQDFTSFRASGCQSNTPFRNIHKISVSRQTDFVIIDIEANAFLHHMVRNIVGSLVEIGRGRKPVNWMSFLLEQKDRNQAGVTAAASGLYFIKANYPSHYKLLQLKQSDHLMY